MVVWRGLSRVRVCSVELGVSDERKHGGIESFIITGASTSSSKIGRVRQAKLVKHSKPCRDFRCSLAVDLPGAHRFFGSSSGCLFAYN